MSQTNQSIEAGDYVRLIHSSNPYVPVGSILRIESLTTIMNRSGCCEVFHVTWKGRKYIVHKEVIQKTNYIAPERVRFT